MWYCNHIISCSDGTCTRGVGKGEGTGRGRVVFLSEEGGVVGVAELCSRIEVQGKCGTTSTRGWLVERESQQKALKMYH